MVERLTGRGKPKWLGSREGISDEVLPPWTPIKVEQKGLKEESPRFSVSCWGRTYEFAVAPFPIQIVTRGRSVLASPVQVIARVDGRVQYWQGGSIKILEQAPAYVRFSQSVASSDLTLSAQTRVEYDGLIRVDWRVEPRRPSRLEKLTIEVPLNSRYARYFYYYPPRSREVSAGALPPEGFVADFRPFVWLGSEDLGLAWFSESDKNWYVAQRDRVIEVVQEGENVMLRLHLVDVPVELAPGGMKTDGAQMPSPERSPLGDLIYTFGLQATPVKPAMKDVWDYRICHAGNYGIETLSADASATLSYLTERNINLDRGTLEFWIKPLFNPLQAKADQWLFSIQLLSCEEMKCYWRAKDGMLCLSLMRMGKAFLELSAQPGWSQDKFHHFALSWGDAVRMYSDGTLIAEKPHKGTLTGDLSGGRIVFGGPGSYFVIDEIRISNVPLTSEEISFIAAGNIPSLDERTLLLDHLDAITEPGVIQHLDGGFVPPHTFPERCWPFRGGGILARQGGEDGLLSFTAGRFGSGLQFGSDKPVLDRLADLGVRTICFHEHWTDIEGYTLTAHEEELRSLMKACHQKGIQLLLYFGFMISDIAPEWPYHRDEILTTTKEYKGSELNIPPQPHQRYYHVCYRSVWQDFLAYGIARMMDEFDIDGVYLDGTAHPVACTNTRHGCGYIRPDGSVAPTYSIWATREMMRRIYTIVKSRKPDGQVNVHNSMLMTTPTLAWATSLWDGEQFPGLGRDMFALDVLPLDAFRTEFMGHQWGIPTELLCYERPFTYMQLCAITLLHDVLVRGNGLGPNLELESKLWRLSDEFGRKEAEWLPYWRNSEYVSVSSKDAYVSLYLHPKNGVLAMISNLSRGEADVEVGFNLTKLGLKGEPMVQNALTKQAITLERGKLKLRLASLEWKIVWLKM